jgi:hypothetical protein
MDLRRVVHRWFVEYNPLYIVSTALVLRGVNLLSHVVNLELGVPAIVEVYAWALVAGAAILNRVGLRRPAVMLSLLAVVYQCDLTLHTETCAYLGVTGALASIVWLASFALKLFALSRAMRLRLSRSAFAVPILGATTLVVVPRLVQLADARTGGIIASSALFLVLASGLWTSRAIESRRALDEWGHTVLRRGTLAVWSILTAAFVVHAAFLFSQRTMDAYALVPLPFVLATRFVRREAYVWLLFAVAVAVAPWSMSLCAFALVLRAKKIHASGTLVPLSVVTVRHLVKVGILTLPASTLEWGVWSVAGGFVVLVATIASSIALNRRLDLAPREPASR